MALIHDIGDTLGAYNHPDIGAAILKPFVSEELHWITAHHGIFQGYYFFHYLGMDRDMRENFRGHPHFEACAHSARNTTRRRSIPNTTARPVLLRADGDEAVRAAEAEHLQDLGSRTRSSGHGAEPRLELRRPVRPRSASGKSRRNP